MRSAPLLFLAIVVLSTTACTTLANRRDLYFPQTVNGPYTRMKSNGIPKPTPVSGVVQGGANSGKQVVKPLR